MLSRIDLSKAAQAVAAGGDQGADIDRCRKAMVLTRSEFAEWLGVSLQALRRWERGGRIPSVAGMLLAQMSADPEYWIGIAPRPGGPVPAVRAVRQTLGLSQNELAELLLISVKTIKRWESGSHPLPAPAQRLMQAFGAHPDYWGNRVRDLLTCEG